MQHFELSFLIIALYGVYQLSCIKHALRRIDTTLEEQNDQPLLKEQDERARQQS